MKLIVTEKPSVGRSIAAALGIKEKKDGYMEGLNAIVTWCIGHLVDLAPAELYDTRYAKWRMEDLPIIPETWKYIINDSTKAQFETVKALMTRGDVDTVVCATDAGREGELIFRLVYNQAGCTKPIQRLWIASMEESAIQEGFRSLRDGTDYNSLYQAALCRDQADWLVGINASRLYSLLYDTTLNVGRVMSPTLALIVKREAVIANFQSETFYTVQLRCGFIANSERMASKEEAEKLAAACHLSTATVKSIDRKHRTEKPPKLYDLTTLQREANRVFGYSAQQTLDYAQSLYEKQLITYPRTDSNYLTEDMRGRLPGLADVVAGANLCTAGLHLTVHPNQVIDSSKVSDHHAMIPTDRIMHINPVSLPAGEQSILQMISVRLLCALGDPHVYDETIVTVECGGAVFTGKGKTIMQMGWKIPEATFRGSLGYRAKAEPSDEDYKLPDFRVGQELSPCMAAVKEGRTNPPGHYTEDTLLAAMENAGADQAPEDAERRGLGTPATRAGIVEKMIASGLVERRGDKKSKYLLPTEKGKALIAVLPEQIKSPVLTAEWENRLKAVERGEADAASFMAGITNLLTDMVSNARSIPGAENLFPSNKRKVGICPHCGSDVLESGKGYYCRNKSCKFVLWKDIHFLSDGRTLTPQMASELLEKKKIFMSGLISRRTGKRFDADLCLKTEEDGSASYHLDFQKKDNTGGSQ